jgi:hypothetical protein
MNKTSIDNEIYDDPNTMLNSRVPRRSVKQKWTYLRSDYYVHRAGSTGADPFRLYLEEIRQIMGTTEDIQVRYRSRLFEQIGHETTFLHLVEISTFCQTYQNYQQPQERLQNSGFWKG